MKHQILLSFLALSGWGTANAQNSVNSSGQSLSGTDGSAGYSLGNVFYKELSGIGGSTAPGTQVPYVITSTLGTDQNFIQLEMAVYPNPVTDHLYLRIDSEKAKQYRAEFYDSKGSHLQTLDIKSKVTEIPMRTYPAGLYFMSVMADMKTIKTFKIIKK